MKSKKFLSVLAPIACCAMLFAGCSLNSVSVTSIEKTASYENEDTYTVTYSDGTSSDFTVRHGNDVTVQDLFDRYKEEYGDSVSYEDFLAKYLSLNADSSASVVGKGLVSSFIVNSSNRTNSSTGSGVLYAVNEEKNDAYIVTNYHVTYITNTYGSGGAVATQISCSLYGSPQTEFTCTYMGGSAASDIALLRVSLSDVKAVNDRVKPVTLASGYTVGETVYAIGNAEGEGISATRGIISVDSEDIYMEVDGTRRTHRAMRIDAALYHGNSGGGLFNSDGELVGITNGGDEDDQNINYAIPLSVVKGTADNILHYYANTSSSTMLGAYKITLGVTVESQNSRYVYDELSGKGHIEETLVVSTVNARSIASSMGLKAQDVLTELIVNGDTVFPLTRSYDIYDALLTVRAGDGIAVNYTRSGEKCTSSTYEVKSSDLTKI